MLYKTGFVSISPTVAEWQATQKCVTDRQQIFPLTAIAPILNGGWGQKIPPLVIGMMPTPASTQIAVKQYVDPPTLLAVNIITAGTSQKYYQMK